ncbi:MAG: LysR family transcriptional regulator [Gammaproteobacteria bacterium]|nr:LysR family transcriptional regulator [Gammaproteobacteria bacterium]MBA3731832.1 LysR family transcriptional regulator [Gammaproteobacteria bacterium]
MSEHSFDNIAAFVRVVEAGSISAAALRLNLAKSVVSKRISDLENRLGVERIKAVNLRHELAPAEPPRSRRRCFFSSADWSAPPIAAYGLNPLLSSDQRIRKLR